MITIWKLIPHHSDRKTALAWTIKDQRIAIGNGFTGDLLAPKYANSGFIKVVIQAAYDAGTHPSDNAHEGSLSLWNLVHEMKTGDYVIMGGSKARETVVEVVGDYFFVDEPHPVLGNYQHQRKVRLTDISAEALWKLAGGKIEAGRSPYATLARCQNQISLGEFSKE